MKHKSVLVSSETRPSSLILISPLHSSWRLAMMRARFGGQPLTHSLSSPVTAWPESRCTSSRMMVSFREPKARSKADSTIGKNKSYSAKGI
ncbi:MAG: hypothetical protein QME73_02910 [Bacillota bacterium]|nr:hypothetical protein [Bacillota bacterium]